MNSRGNVVGQAYSIFLGWRSIIYLDEELVELDGEGVPLAVNANNQVAGFGSDGAVFWGANGAIKNLIPPDGTRGYGAYSINDAGAMVGLAIASGSKVAVYWPDAASKGIDLNTLLSAEQAASWRLREADAINRWGQIAGYGRYNNQATAFLLTPAALSVDANRDGRVTSAKEDQTSAEKPFRFWINDDVDGIPGYEDESLDLRFPDYTDGYIASRRDLEDFARLHVYLGGLEDAVTNGQIFVGLKWKPGYTGNPSINIYPAVEADGGDKYLTDVNVANQQVVDPFRRVVPNKDGSHVRVDTSSTFIFGADFWSGLSASGGKKYLLFEGCTEGKGQLVLVLLKPDGTEIGEGPGVWLDLKNIKSMYERAKATTGGALSPNGIDYTIPLPPDYTGPNDSNIPNPTMGWVPDERGFPFQPDPREDLQNKNYIVFVHGWRQSPEQATSYAETMFKRLWQRGYKGRFAAFRWPTFYGGPEIDDDNIEGYTTYNDSEYRAWKSGESLKKYVNGEPSSDGSGTLGIPSGYTRNLAAHSMGNIVAGSAFKFGMSVTNYALLNAAVPAMCYDENPAIWQADWNFVTPNDDPDPGTKGLAYIGQLKTINANVVNFFLEADSATRGSWNINNTGIGAITFTSFKPQRYNLRTTGYDYNPNDVPGHRVFITFFTAFGRYLIDPHESMAYACRSLTYTVNADGSRTNGSIDSRVDMSAYGFGTEHSAEWKRKLHDTWAFYDQLLTEFRLPTLP